MLTSSQYIEATNFQSREPEKTHTSCSTSKNYLSQNKFRINDPNGETEEQWILKLLSKYHFDPTIDEAEIMILHKHVVQL